MGIVFISFFSAIEFFLYSRATDLFTLILYPDTLPNSLMSSYSFLIESFVSPMSKTMPTASRDNLTSLIPVWIPLIYVSCLIALARYFNAMLNINGESGYHSLASHRS